MNTQLFMLILSRAYKQTNAYIMETSNNKKTKRYGHTEVYTQEHPPRNIDNSINSLL